MRRQAQEMRKFSERASRRLHLEVQRHMTTLLRTMSNVSDHRPASTHLCLWVPCRHWKLFWGLGVFSIRRYLWGLVPCDFASLVFLQSPACGDGFLHTVASPW
jgi:hypothetical protein